MSTTNISMFGNVSLCNTPRKEINRGVIGLVTNIDRGGKFWMGF